jgi:cell wall-associated NlpC family hydrolase
MSTPPTTPHTSLRAAALAVLVAAANVQAAPELPVAPATASSAAQASAATGDAVLQLLQDRGLLPSAEAVEANPVVRQVRDAASGLVIAAMTFLGVHYKRGGNSAAEGFDCSGFTRHVFENSLGLVLPRRAEQQATLAGLLEVTRDELRPGDLVFFNTMRRTFSHVGIYVGEGKFIHAPRSGANVRIEDMREAYWAKRYNGARRADPAAAPVEAADAATTARR